MFVERIRNWKKFGGTLWKNLAFSLVVACLDTAPAFAQSDTPTMSQTTPALSTSGKTNPGAPVAVKNSFMEAEAKSRMEDAGYQDVTALKLDEQGVWRATVTKDRKQVNVSLDFQGNVVILK